MHSYHHNIKTFNNATRHLTRVERSLYRDLIELYYDSEKPLPADNFDRISRLVMANSEEEKAALRYILDEFFVLSGDLYTHNYCDEQIEKFYSNTTAKALAGKASAKARLEKQEQRKREREYTKQTSVEQNPTGVQQNPTNNEPVTSNHINNYPTDSVPLKELVELFNEMFPELPKVKMLTDRRKAALRRRWLENEKIQSLDRWRDFFEFIRKSDFLMGRTNPNPWNGFCFDWLINQGNFTKIIEGNYHK